MKNEQKTFASLSKNSARKEKKRKTKAITKLLQDNKQPTKSKKNKNSKSNRLTKRQFKSKKVTRQIQKVKLWGEIKN